MNISLINMHEFELNNVNPLLYGNYIELHARNVYTDRNSLGNYYKEITEIAEN